MKNRRILEVYETRKERELLDTNFPGIEDGVMPEDIHAFIRSQDGFVDISTFENMPQESSIILMNVEISIVKNLIEICDICVHKECVLALFTDTMSKHDDEFPDYKKYLAAHWGDNVAAYTIYPIDWVDETPIKPV